MNEFDFSIYDLDDDTPPEEVSKKKKSQEKPVEFDFSIYEPNEENISESESEINPEEDKIYQQYRTSEKTPEEIKNMSFDEKRQYAEDLNREREYLQSAGFTKGALSGLTLGTTEHLDVLKPKEHELMTGFGEFVGSALPIMATAKAVSIPIKYGLSNLIKNPRTLSSVSKLMTAFGTGSTYETGKELVKGEGLNPKEIVKKGTEFATIDLLFRAGSKGFDFLKQLNPSQRAKFLENAVIPEGLSASQYETAENILNEFKLNNEPKDIGIIPKLGEEKKHLADTVGDLFSDQKFYNTTKAGESIKEEVMNIDQDVYRGVNELYNISKELNKDISEIHPQLNQRIESSLNDMRKIPEPSDVQKRLIRAQEKIRNNLAEYEVLKDEEGKVIRDEFGKPTKELIGYKPISNQTLIEQIQSLRQIIDYDFAHGNTKNIFKPLIRDIENAVSEAATSSGNEQAVEALSDAKSAYKAWSQAFDNDYIRPFRDASNRDFSKLYKSSLDFDESNVLRSILNLSENGRNLSNMSTRDIVEKNLSKYIENPKNIDSREFFKSIRELESVITPEQSESVKNIFKEEIKANQLKEKTTPSQEIASKYTKKTPEDVQEMMNSRTGIKELRKDLKGSPEKEKLFEKLSKQKVRSILREGNIEKEFTGDDLYKFLNKEKNYEILSEILGEETTEAMRLEAKRIGKSQVRRESVKKGIKKASTLKGMMFLYSVI